MHQKSFNITGNKIQTSNFLKFTNIQVFEILIIFKLQETYRPNFEKKQRNKCSKKDQSVKTEETFYGNRYLVVPSPQMVVNKSLAKRFTHQNDGAIKTSAVVEATFLGGTKIEYSNEVSIDFMTMITLSDFLVFFRHFEKKQFFLLI